MVNTEFVPDAAGKIKKELGINHPFQVDWILLKRIRHLETQRDLLFEELNNLKITVQKLDMWAEDRIKEKLAAIEPIEKVLKRVAKEGSNDKS